MADGYYDFHNHWDGILMPDVIIEMYKEKFDTADVINELKALGIKPNGNVHQLKNFNSLAGLFVRLSFQIHCKFMYGYNKKTKQFDGLGEIGEFIQYGRPSRGAHMYQHMLIYLGALLYAGAYELDRDPGNYLKKRRRILCGSARKVLKDHLIVCQFCESMLAAGYRMVLNNGAVKYNSILKPLAGRGIMKFLRATKMSSFDDAYVGRSAFKKTNKSGYKDVWNQATGSYLWDPAGGKTTYAQISQPVSKLPQEKEAKQFNTDIHWIGLVATHRIYLEQDKAFEVIQKHVRDVVKTMNLRDDVIGIDFAGPEGFRYDQERCEKLLAFVVNEMNKPAKLKKRKKLIRIHTGEGAITSNTGDSIIENHPGLFCKALPGDLKDHLKIIIGDGGHRLARQIIKKWARASKMADLKLNYNILKHTSWAKESKRIATHNTRAVINAIESLYRKGKIDLTNIHFRFGHVTHLDLASARKMAALGVSADVNIGSNFRTGSFGVLKVFEDADERKRDSGKWNKPKPGELKNHGVMKLRKAGVKIVLGSDGQGVESTEIKEEYDYNIKLAGQHLKRRAIKNGEIERGMFPSISKTKKAKFDANGLADKLNSVMVP